MKKSTSLDRSTNSLLSFRKAVTLAVLVGAIVAAAVVSQAGTSFEILEFIDGRDGTATLIVLCKSQKQVRITFKRKHLDRVNIDRLYDEIEGECERN